MGRKNMDTKKIENVEAMRVTFSKRKAGVFKKASELHTLCGAEIALVVFSPAGKPFTLGVPSFGVIADRFLGVNSTPDPAALHVEEYRTMKFRELGAEYIKALEKLDAEKLIAEKLKEEMNAAAVNQAWWEQPIENMGLGELEMLYGLLEDLKKNIENEAIKLINSSNPSVQPKMNPMNAVTAPQSEPTAAVVVPAGYLYDFAGTSQY